MQYRTFSAVDASLENNKKVFIREALIIFGIVAAAFFFDKLGYLTFDIPFQKGSHDHLPKYSIATKNDSMVVFENGLVLMCKRPLTDEEVKSAYTGKDTSLVVQILHPAETYKDAWIFHVNRTFGFVGIEFNKLTPWIMLLVYPFYWVIRFICLVVDVCRE